MKALELAQISRGRAPPPPPRRQPPPTRAQVSAVAALERLTQKTRHEADDAEGDPSLDMTDVFGGVSVGWLAKVFAMDPTDVKKRLGDCPPLHRRKAGYIYDLKMAARYIVKPVFDVKKYIETMKPSELPTQLQDTYWKSQLSRQKYELNAGELWRTADVMEVLGEVFKVVKFTLQLWADNLERATGLTEPQRKTLLEMVDGLQNELHQSLLDLRRTRRTPSSKEEIEAELGGDDLGLV